MYDHNALPPEGPARQPIFKIPPATLGLALVLILVFLLLRVLPAETEGWALATFGYQPGFFLAALDGQAPLLPALWPFATHLLLHYDALHLITNVGFLVAFATPVERRIGALGFLAAFLVCGIAGALAQTYLIFDPAQRAELLIGASGGIFGLMGAALVLGPDRTGPRLATGPIILVLMGLNLAIGLASEFGWVGDYLIGWQAHAGGFLAGLPLGWAIRRSVAGRS